MSSIAKSLLYIKQNNLGDRLIKFKNSEYIPLYLISGVIDKSDRWDFNKNYFGYFGENEAFVKKIADKVKNIEAEEFVKSTIFQVFINCFKRARNNGINVKGIEGAHKAAFIKDMLSKLQGIENNITISLIPEIDSSTIFFLKEPNNSYREKEDNILNRLNDYQGIRYTRLFKRREDLFNRAECMLAAGFCAKYSNSSINAMYCLQVKKEYVKELRLLALLEEPIDYSNFRLLIHPDFDTPKTQSKQMRKFYRKYLLPEYKELGIKIVKDKDIDNTLFDVKTIPAFRTIPEYNDFIKQHSDEIKKLICPEEEEWDEDDEYDEDEYGDENEEVPIIQQREEATSLLF